MSIKNNYRIVDAGTASTQAKPIGLYGYKSLNGSRQGFINGFSALVIFEWLKETSSPPRIKRIRVHFVVLFLFVIGKTQDVGIQPLNFFAPRHVIRRRSGCEYDPGFNALLALQNNTSSDIMFMSLRQKNRVLECA